MLNNYQINTLRSSGLGSQKTGGGSNFHPSQPLDETSLKSWIGSTPSPTATEAGSKPGIISKMGQDIQTAGKNVENAISGTGDYEGQSAVRRGTGAVAEAIHTPIKMAGELLTDPVKKGIKTVAEAAIPALKVLPDINQIITKLSDVLGSTKLAQDFVTKHPDAAKTLEEMAGTAANLGSTAGDIAAIGGATEIANGVAKGLSSKINPDAKTLSDYVDKISKTHETAANQMSNDAFDTNLHNQNIDTAGQIRNSEIARIGNDTQTGVNLAEQSQGLPGKEAVYPVDIAKSVGAMKDDILTNFTKGFGADTKITNAISQLDPAKFSSVADFSTAVKQAISQNAPSMGSAISESAAGVTKNIKDSVGSMIEKAPALVAEDTAATAANKFQDALDMTKPVLNKKGSISALEKAGMKGGVEANGSMKTIERTPSLRDNEIAKSVENQVVKGKPIDSIVNINSEIARISEQEIRPFLQKNAAPFNSKTLNSYIEANTTPPDYIKADPVLQKTYDLARQRMVEVAGKGKMNMEGLWDARKEFDNIAEKQIGSLDPTSEKVTAIKQAVLDTRRAVNDFIGDNTPGGDANFKAKMKQLSNMYEGRGNIAEANYKTIGTNVLQRWAKANPTKANLLKYGVGFYVSEKLLKTLGVPL